MARLPKANFQSYATGRSNKAVQMPYGLLNRINERNQTVIRGMKEQESRRESLANRRISDTSETFRKAEANRQELKQLEDKAGTTRMASEERLLRSKLRSHQQEKDNATAFASSIQNLSTTWAEALLKMGKIKGDEEASEAYTKAWNEGIPRDREIVRNNAELLLENSEKITGDLATRLQQAGAPFWLVQSFSGLTKPQSYGKMKAYSEMAAADWPVFFQKGLGERNLSKASEIDAILPSLRDEFLKERGLFGLSADFMGPMFQKMKQSTNALLNTSRLEEGKSNAKEIVGTISNLFKHELKERGLFVEDDNPYGISKQYLSNTLNKLMMTINPDSLQPNGYNRNYHRTEAIDLIFNWMENVSLVPGEDDEIRDFLENQTILDENGKPISDLTWGSKFITRLDELIQERGSNRRKALNNELTNDKQKQSDFEQKAEEVVNSLPGGFNVQVVDHLIKLAKDQGWSTDKLQARLYAQSIDGINEAYWNQYFGDLERDGLLTTAELTEPWVSSKVVAAFQNKAKVQDELNMAAIGTSDTLNKSLSNLLKGLLKVESTTAISDSSLQLAEYRAFRRFKRYVKDFLDKDEPSTKAVSKAWDKIHTEIKDGKNDPGSLWHITSPRDLLKRKSGNAYFTNFTFGENDDKEPGKVVLNSYKLKDNVSDQQILKWDKEIILKDSLIGLVDHQVNNNSMISVPGTVHDLVAVFNEDKPLEKQITVVDVLNAQLKLGGYSTQIKTDWRKDLMIRAGELSNMDPGILKLVREIRTPEQLKNFQLVLIPSKEGYPRNRDNMSNNLSSRYDELMKLNIDQLNTIAANNDPGTPDRKVPPTVEFIESPVTTEEWHQLQHYKNIYNEDGTVKDSVVNPEKSKEANKPLTKSEMTSDDRKTNLTQFAKQKLGISK